MEPPWTPPFCTIVNADTSDMTYLSCSQCSRVLPITSLHCSICSLKYSIAPPSRLLFRLLLSIATSDKVTIAICFDRAARVLLGCSAEEFVRFCSDHPEAGDKARELLQGEMCRMTFKQPRNGNAEHSRVVSVRPLRAGFRPVIDSLRRMYGEVEA